jgi:transglutaminase/protease-like cytokinesis protein 3
LRKITILFLLLFFNIIIAQVSDFNNVDFTRADNIAKLNKGESLENLPLLSYKLTSKLTTDVEKFRAIYTWVCNNIDGDFYQQSRILRKRKKHKKDSVDLIKWNNHHKKIAFKKLLKYKKTMCTGYAYLIKELAFLADIESEIINGYGRDVDSNVDKLEMANHSWNAVKLNGKWYLCDATWSSGYIDEKNSFVNDFNDGYFLADPIMFSKNHYPLDTKWLLNSQTTSTTFVTSPIVYAEAFEYKVFPLSPSKMDLKVKKKGALNFKIKNINDISSENISLVIFSGIVEKNLNIYDIKKENNFIFFKNKFNLVGFYDIHLKVDQDIIATYTVEVNAK